jgi:RNA polymerase sigma-70 factor (ECF subfamily)
MRALTNRHQVTRLLADWANGNQQALDDLTPLVYRELRQLAASYLRKENPGHTLQPTALVHEAYLRLVDQKSPDWEGRSHFFGVAAHLMRQILVDHARRRQAGKRAVLKVSLEEAVSFQPERSRDLVALDSGLRGSSARERRRQGRVVRLSCCPTCQEGMSHGDSRRCTAYLKNRRREIMRPPDWKIRVRLFWGRWRERASLEQSVCPRACLEMSVSLQVCTPRFRSDPSTGS